MIMSKHAELPWRVETANWFGLGYGVVTQKGEVVAACREVTPDADKENAQLIVTAVNNHAKLVELLRIGTEVWGDYLCTGGGSPEAHSRFIKKARKFTIASQDLLAQLDGEVI